MLRRFIFPLVLTFAGVPAAIAQPSSEVAWTVPVLQALKTANLENGREVGAQVCAECHGENGVDPDDINPNIAGQRATYIYKQLVDINTGTRAARRMARRIDELSDQDFIDVSAWYATLPMERRGEPAPMPELVTRGDQTRMINSCASCHGKTVSGGDIDVPILAGQHKDSLVYMLELFRDGERANDVYGRMREAAAQLTDEEIEALAAYYAGVPVE